jgi:sigma-B regulation protein RsbU (phosphoserine phosphatase)
LVCSGIWGGIRDLDQDIRTDAADASLYSSWCDGGKGGDIYFVGACKGCMLTRVAIADVVGHGQAVSDVSQYMYDCLKAHICDPDSGTILSELNQLASRQGLNAMTTAAVVAYSGLTGKVYLSYAGHPPLMLKRANEKAWTVAAPGNHKGEGDRPGRDLPLAVVPDAVYDQHVIPMSPGGRLFVYTDGVTEAPNAEGELFGAERLRNVLDANEGASLPQLKSMVLQALHRHTGNGLTHDDVTLIAMEVR